MLDNTLKDPSAHRCGHNFAFKDCPYKYCVARGLYKQYLYDNTILNEQEMKGSLESLADLD